MWRVCVRWMARALLPCALGCGAAPQRNAEAAPSPQVCVGSAQDISEPPPTHDETTHGYIVRCPRPPSILDAVALSSAVSYELITILDWLTVIEQRGRVCCLRSRPSCVESYERAARSGVRGRYFLTVAGDRARTWSTPDETSRAVRPDRHARGG